VPSLALYLGISWVLNRIVVEPGNPDDGDGEGAPA
jgi:hypothetical protein